MKLIEVLKKMKVGELKKEIAKQNIKGYSKMKKAEIIKLMTDRPDRFKYLLLQNMQQKKELLQDKVKLKEAKEKLKKVTEKKSVKPAPKPASKPEAKKIITTKTGVVKVTPKKLNEIQLLELKLKKLEDQLRSIKSPSYAKNSTEAQKIVKIKNKLNDN